ncbi:hypothetical protein DS2_12694 [Catenovulum agarivorans DS-2]|uniref:Uncharacterized protein n=1 Tax=Catenovulum agarivorans DS-2 TaxID=1328313 RepID=W7QNB3_9ALTE|nr:hypothetical protein [Catenovulum agarivorans]EWH09393.1 hypothetical protein DS2_12694 [Catenovulum agarivorans DS-2]
MKKLAIKPSTLTANAKSYNERLGGDKSVKASDKTRALLQSDFIGCGKAESDLSENFKFMLFKNK